MHIDDFIVHGTIREKCDDELYARWFLLHKRLSACEHFAFHEYIDDIGKLFCKYEGDVYRVTGASRMGDVWLTSYFERKTGYEKRIEVEDIECWGKTPEEVKEKLI